ncbi:hypothetical protein K5D34_14675 [Pseudomonas cichorii]|nr:hypothetical protein [Pseudomonas cichorii]MBX8510926.1 hypothetical protein [Pseudomonas cichorii]MBX8525759.1 hypothetical protein [Pseudomonas cichorii]
MDTYQKSNYRSSFKAIHEQFARVFVLSETRQDSAISLHARLGNILTPRSQDLMRNAFDERAPLQAPAIADLITPSQDRLKTAKSVFISQLNIAPLL